MQTNIDIIRHPLLLNKTRHGFFTRLGGVSKGDFSSLNCGFKSHDDPDAIQENRRRVAELLEVKASHLWGGLQIHSTKVEYVTQKTNTLTEADAGVTDDPTIAVSIVTADCAPVLFSTKDGKIVGAAHAGWRGAADGILERVVTEMELLGAKAQEIIAVVGPCIDGNQYKVKEDMRQQVLSQDKDAESFFNLIKNEQYVFDLGRYCIDRLKRCGIGVTAFLERDTLSDSKHFFSHRRRTLAGGGQLGHQISAISCCKG